MKKSSVLFTRYLCGLQDDKIDYRYRFYCLLPWLRSQVEKDGFAFKSSGYTKEEAMEEIDKYLIIFMNTLAELLLKGEVNLIEAIFDVMPILRQGVAMAIVRDGVSVNLVSWESLGFHENYALKHMARSFLRLRPRRPPKLTDEQMFECGSYLRGNGSRPRQASGEKHGNSDENFVTGEPLRNMVSLADYSREKTCQQRVKSVL